MEKNKAKLESKTQAILNEVDKHIEQDKQEKTPDALSDMDSCGLRKRVSALNKRLSGMNKAEQKQVKKLQEEYLPRLDKYESQLEKLGDLQAGRRNRNSYPFMENTGIENLSVYSTGKNNIIPFIAMPTSTRILPHES